MFGLCFIDTIIVRARARRKLPDKHAVMSKIDTVISFSLRFMSDVSFETLLGVWGFDQCRRHFHSHLQMRGRRPL